MPCAYHLAVPTWCPSSPFGPSKSVGRRPRLKLSRSLLSPPPLSLSSSSLQIRDGSDAHKRAPLHGLFGSGSTLYIIYTVLVVYSPVAFCLALAVGRSPWTWSNNFHCRGMGACRSNIFLLHKKTKPLVEMVNVI